jgi:signal transduction histidine kinase
MEYNTKSMTILVVDDTPENISIIGEYLSPYQVKVATSGVKALHIAETTELDLILLDIKMPDMDGYEVCRKLKENPKTNEIPVIFLTVMSETPDIVKGFSLGAVDYITKPFQIEEVKSRIETHLTLNAYKKLLQNVNQDLERKIEARTRELLFAKNKAEEASRLKSYFLGLISHELKTPMIGIMGFTEILMDEAKDDSLKDYAIAANQSAKRLEATLESILNLADYYANKQAIKLIPINLNKRINKLLSHHRKNAELKKLDVVFIENEELTTAMDWAMFDVIINNVVGNAIKYTEKGKVEIRLSKEKRNNNKYDCICVMDSGIGIPDEKQSTIFEEFRQVDESFTRNFQGIGLGLALVKKFIDLHDGILELESQEGKGSCFKMKFPHVNNLFIKESNGKNKTEINVPDKWKTKKPKVLLIENDLIKIKSEQERIKNVLDIITTNDGFEAVELARKNMYDAVLVNLNLELGIPGIEIVKEIKIINGYEKIPILGYTTNLEDKNFISAFDEEDQQCLPKSNSQRELFELLKELC